ncbi:MAG: PAS domain S-box protein [Deltaproteobacteria bacterium]|nr:PAS domain S-box protein [Deltaproteobacteria bacterium]MBW1928354.1 PAS domain S-box protein [Deltaproteobacteria bacterium]MBW2027199.1 PAS domain S-box protein [Deltaproteobacteria bacterium]MBW2125038.1 PAS domain S-box protein [Deltaproteobacteria bacterium]
MLKKDSPNLASVLDAMEDGIYVINDRYLIEFMNMRMVQDFGNGTGKKCYNILQHRDSVCPWCRAQEVFKGSTVRWELHIAEIDKAYDLIELPLRNPDGTVSKLSICRDITQRKKREERIKASEEDYRRLFEHVKCGVYVSSKEGKFLNANPALLEMLGYESKEEFLNIDIRKDLYLRPEDRDKFQEMIERRGYVIDYEVEFKRRDGTPIPVLLTSHVRYAQDGRVLGYEGIIVDQSERKEMERSLREAHDFLNKIIHSSPNPIIATDMSGNIILWNRAAEEVLGYKARDVIGKMNIEKIYPEGMARKVMQMMRSQDYGGVGRLRSYPMVHIRQDGKVIEGSLSAAIIYDAEGKEMASVGIFVDLTERLEMEEKLRRTQEQLLHSEKLAAMGRLTSQIAHELNNPLYGIMNTLELLKSEIPEQSKRRKILEMALSETVRLTDLLKKMLSFSRPDQEERQVTSIKTILEEILLLYEKQLREHGIRVVEEFDDNVGPVFASRNQLRQVFLNIIANARDAMPNGGTLKVKTESQDGNVLIRISDTGTGIKKSDINKIFDAFFTTKDSVKGVGLGLSVCYGFIKDHGGDIWVESEYGSGSTFTISLPLYRPPRQ